MKALLIGFIFSNLLYAKKYVYTQNELDSLKFNSTIQTFKIGWSSNQPFVFKWNVYIDNILNKTVNEKETSIKSKIGCSVNVTSINVFGYESKKSKPLFISFSKKYLYSNNKIYYLMEQQKLFLRCRFEELEASIDLINWEPQGIRIVNRELVIQSFRQ